MVHISIVIPLFDEKQSIPILIDEIDEIFRKNRIETDFGNKLSYEIIVIDDGSTDSSLKVLKKIAVERKHLKIIVFQKNYGKSAALSAGFSKAQGNYIITMDADLQDNPQAIPQIIYHLNNFDLVNCRKQKRQDTLSKRLSSKLFNLVTRKLTSVPIRDFNSGLKGYRKKVIKSLDIYGEMHRYIPAIACNKGFTITEISVLHRKRQFGKTKFGLSRFSNGFFDLLTVLFITKYLKKPMHFFGVIGLACFSTGFAINLYILYTKMALDQPISQRPILLLGILLIILGVQFFSIGLVSELVIKDRSHASDYIIKDEVNFH